MSHSLSPVSSSDIPSIVTAEPFKVSAAVKTGLWALVAIGIVCFLYALTGQEPKTAWISLQVNFTYWFMVSMGSTCFVAVLQICNGQWARPIRRIFEASSSFLPFILLPLVVLIFGHQEIFAWSTEAHTGKELWLNSTFFYVRDILAAVILILMGRRVVFLSVSRDIGAIRGGLTGVEKNGLERWKGSFYDKYVADWSENTLSEITRVSHSLGMLSPAMVVAYFLLMSLLAFDQIMSVDYHWYSTLFGVLFFMSGAYIAMAFASMSMPFVRRIHPLFRAKIERRTLHDLGKLLFGFGIFWAYMFWSHYLPIWYANIPEFTGWMILRLREDTWHGVAWFVLTTCFFIPFLLGLSRDIKQIPVLLAATGLIVSIGLWVQQYLLFTPTLYPHSVPLSFADLGLSLGFLGAYILACLSFLEKAPLMPFGDFYLED